MKSKFEALNPKFETNSNNQKKKIFRNDHSPMFGSFYIWDLFAACLFRISIFGFRIFVRFAFFARDLPI